MSRFGRGGGSASRGLGVCRRRFQILDLFKTNFVQFTFLFKIRELQYLMTPMYFPFKVFVILKLTSQNNLKKSYSTISRPIGGWGGGGGFGCPALFPGKKTVGTRLIIENFFFNINNTNVDGALSMFTPENTVFHTLFQTLDPENQTKLGGTQSVTAK